MQSQIRPSSLVLAVLMSVGLVAGSIVFRPSLTQALYVRYALLIAGAGLIVTLYNYFLTMRMRGRAQQDAEEMILSPPPVEMPPQEADTVTAAPAAYAATAETALPEAAFPAAADPAEEMKTEERRMVVEIPSRREAEELPGSLDGLLDVAYEAAEHNPLRAVAAYRRALTRYPDDSYVPYLIIELSTLYKRLGDYDAALALFDEALALPVIAKNAVMAQEFHRSRRVLTVVSHILAAQGTPTLPFGDVPRDLLLEADQRAEELGKH